MGKFGDFMKDLVPSALSAFVPVVGQLLQARSQRREYNKMLEYNSPKAQMQRYSEAGLSPYLIYSQGNSGNVSSPRPAEAYPTEGINAGIDRYMAMSNFDVDMKNKWMQYWNMQNVNTAGFYAAETAELERDRKQLEMYSDYPDLLDGISKEVASTGYRRKLLELKRAASEATVEKARQSVENLRYKNVVDKVRAGYARDYGMVGGDWTQGLGLLKSIPSWFKRGRAVPSGKAGVPPWRGSIKVNPILPVKRRRVGGFPKGGFTRP